jgi:DNA-binding MarR family transcriptional regulator
VDKGWTSRAVDQLLADELVEKSAVDTDRRTFTISLTRAGRDRHRRLETTLNQQVARVIERVPRAERAAVERALRALHEAYTAELAGGEAEAQREKSDRLCASP